MRGIILLAMIIGVIVVSEKSLYAQGVAINNDGSDAHASAMLDISAGDKGVLVPRVSIADLSTAAPVAAPAAGLLVYNTSTGTGQGYFYWNGTAWVQLTTADDERPPKWNGVSSTSTDIGRSGNVGIGTSSPDAKFHVAGDAYFGTSTGTNPLRVGRHPARDALSEEEVRFTVDDTYYTQHYIQDESSANFLLKLESTGSESGSPSYAELHARSTGLFNWNDKLYVATSGNVGVNTTSPASPLHVDASAYNGTAMIVDRYASGGVASIQAGPSNEYLMLEGQGTTGKVGINFYSSGNVSLANGGGDVGVGTNNPSAQLHTTGTVRFANYTNGFLRVDGVGNLSVGSGSDLFDAGDGLTWDGNTLNSLWKENGTHIYNGNTENVGIGTSTPEEKLEVAGRLEVDNAGSGAIAYLKGGSDDTSYEWVGFYSGETRQGIMLWDGSWSGAGSRTNEFSITAENGNWLTLTSNTGTSILGGNVGVGLTNPGGKLHISLNNGTDNPVIIDKSSGGGNGPLMEWYGYSTTHRLQLNYTGNYEFNTDNTSRDIRFYPGNNEISLHLDAANQNVGIGTITPSEKLHVDGNAKANGYIVAGTATTTSTTRREMKEFYWSGHKSVDDGYVAWSLGSIPLPDGASNIRIRNIYCDFDGYHEDGNEGYGAWIYINSTTYSIGMTEDNVNGFVDVDWNFNSEETGLSWYFYSAPTIYARIRDDGGSWGDDMHALNIKVQVYYEYTVGLQDGDIAASGRVYANNTQSVGDLAEHFEYDGPVAPGFVVSYVPGSDNEYVRCSEPYSDHITGVISENPSVVLNSPEQGPPIALAGRVKVKLVDSGELIKGGDFITSSDQPGLAQKAIRPGPVIGYAVKNQNPGEDSVEILLQPGKFYFPDGFMDKAWDDMDPEGQEPGKRKSKW